MRSRIAIILGVVLMLFGLAPAPVGAATYSERKCWGLFAGSEECVIMESHGGRQRDGTGVYADSVNLDCLGAFEDHPAVDGYSLTVRRITPAGEAILLYKHDNPNVHQEGDGWCNDRTFGTTQKRWKGWALSIVWHGKARRDNGDRDKEFQLHEVIVE